MTINLEGFNENQKKAVLTRNKRTLVLAGAGSGKTKVLTTRIGYLLSLGVDSTSILAVTFTNKASNEMKLRVNKIISELELNINSKDIWIGTFHSICHKILREHYDFKNFTIIDDQEQKKIIKNILTDIKFQEINAENIKNCLKFISEAKNEKLLPEQAFELSKLYPSISSIQNVYKLYEQEKETMNILDYDDLIFKTVLLLEKNKFLKEKYSTQFKHILVDEYQDTNLLQENLISLFTNENNYLFVVGDDDQSIYGWRGAKVGNILNFNKKNINSEIIILNQNYRSTQNILDASNSVISKNKNRYGKNLFTTDESGHLIDVYQATSPDDEAYHYVKVIKNYINNGYNYSDIVILYRNNFISRNFESKLSENKIPYKIIGGLGFWSRLEIKDILSFLYVVYNQNLNIHTERTFNLLKGVGIKTVEKIKFFSKENKINYYLSIKKMIENKEFKGKNLKLFQHYVNVIDNAKSKLESPYDLVNFIIEEFNISKFYIDKEGEEKGLERYENIKEMIYFLKNFSNEFKQNDLSDFFEMVSLQQDNDKDKTSDNFVKLMTMHSAKGLEFPVVLLAGIEEGIIPNTKVLADKVLSEEERRLMYVSMTRAMKILHISYAPFRFGSGNITGESRYISDIPKNIISGNHFSGNQNFNYRNKPYFNKFKETKTHFDNPYNEGDNYNDENFGKGVILSSKIIGKEVFISVDFDFIGVKLIKKTI